MNTVRGIIYLYISPSTKCYVGQTIEEDKRRKSFLNINQKYGGSKIDNARKKYKPENFIYEIIYEDWFNDEGEAKKILNEVEVYYIELYNSLNNGYNFNIGGGSNFGYVHSDETKKTISENTKKQWENEDFRSSMTGGNNPMKREENKAKFRGENHPLAKSVIIFDLYGEPIKAYKNLKDAIDELKISNHLFYDKPKSYYRNYAFKVISPEEYELFINNKAIFIPEYTECLRYVAQISNNEIINCFSSAKEAKEKTGITTINQALSGHSKTAKGYFWKWITYDEYINWKRLL